MERKVILHLCADIGSDSLFYQLDSSYYVIKVGKDVGVENFHNHYNRLRVHGIIANPVCTEFSTVNGFDKVGNLEKGMKMVNHCIRIIDETRPEWHLIENPFNGRLKELIGKPTYTYQPWEFGSPWTKKTALWGNFVMPKPLYRTWEECPKIEGLYVRPGRMKPGLVYMHKSAVEIIPEFQWAKELIKNDADLRSMCSRGFAASFKQLNP